MFYIYDTTEKNNRGEIPVKLFSSPQSLIAHLEKISPKILGKTRFELMQDAADLGFGEDDKAGKTFFMFLSEYLNMGIVRKDGTPVQCNIFTETEYNKAEYGQ